MEKSYVTITARVCPVCGKQTMNNELLLHKRMRKVFDTTTVTGVGLCEEHQKMVDDGYIFLIELDPKKSGVSLNTERVKMDEAYCTGHWCALRREAYDKLFTKSWEHEQPFAFCDPHVIEMLKNIPQQE